MDLLDQVAGCGQDLLTRVDSVLLVGGAPSGHELWPLLRELRALPAEVFAAVAGTDPSALTQTADQVSALAGEYRSTHDRLGAVPDGAGPTAEVIRAQGTALANHLAADVDNLTVRLAATAACLYDTARWAARARLRMAGAVAECLGSAEAVLLRGVPPVGGNIRVDTWMSGSLPAAGRSQEVVAAAARLAVPVLAAGVTALRGGEALRRRWAECAAELPYRPPLPPTIRSAGAVSRLEW